MAVKNFRWPDLLFCSLPLFTGRDGRDGRKGLAGARGFPGPKGICILKKSERVIQHILKLILLMLLLGVVPSLSADNVT